MTKEQSQFTIFITEDDAWYGQKLTYLLGMDPNYKVTLFESAELLLENLDSKPDLITIDFNLPGITGDQLFEKIQKRIPNLPVIVISSQVEISVALKLLKLGVKDYIVKNDNTKDFLIDTINKIRENQSVNKEIVSTKESLSKSRNSILDLVSESSILSLIHRMISQVIDNKIIRNNNANFFHWFKCNSDLRLTTSELISFSSVNAASFYSINPELLVLLSHLKYYLSQITRNCINICKNTINKFAQILDPGRSVIYLEINKSLTSI
jgi:FixJ family two-component response regulator